LSAKRKETELTWRDIDIGSVIAEPGNAVDYKTGDWRSERPVLNKERCIKCGICYIYCPEGCIHQNDEGHFEADLYHCKGCGICARECWTQAIKMVPEEE
jgi:pyruvate ferredoxin oxidoreductase delta subunit